MARMLSVGAVDNPTRPERSWATLPEGAPIRRARFRRALGGAPGSGSGGAPGCGGASPPGNGLDLLQADVVLGQAAGGGLGGGQVVEAGLLDPEGEGVVVGGPVEQGGHPAGEVLGPPDAAQAGGRP